MKLEGDQEGIEALKALKEKNKEALKFLVQEARTNTDLTARFKSEAGKPFKLRVDPATQGLIVEAG